MVKSDSAEKGSGAVLGCVGVLPAVETTGGGIGAANRGAGNDEGGAPTAAGGGPPGTADAEAEGEGGVGRECEEALLLAAAAAGECESGAEGTDVGIAGGQPGGTPAALLVVVLLSVGLG